MSIPYAKRVQAETPTKIHVNNPTLAEARAALDFDVMGATTNPTFLKRLIGLEVDQDRVFAALDRIVATERDDHAAAEKLMIAMVGKLADLYMPVFEETKGRRGVVFIQGNPFRDGDADAMISEAERFFAIAPNIIVKLPSNFAGYRAFRELTAMGKPLCATSSLSLSQEETFFKAYNDIHGEDGKWPVLHVTSLAGILDEFTKKYAAEHGISLSEDALDKGGNLFTKLGYRMLREAGYRGTLLGGAARHFKHFTEMVGSDFESTLNHVFIRQLNDENPPIVSRYEDFYSDEVREELLEKLPYYRQAIERDAMKPEEFDAYLPFVYFRSSFTSAWSTVVDVIAGRRDNGTARV